MTAAVHTPAAPSDIAGLHLHLTTLIEQLSELEMSANHPPRRNARALLAEAQDAYDQAAREVETFHYPEALESIARAYRVLHLELTPTLKRWRDATTSATERDALDAILADLEAAFGDEEAA